MSLSNMLDLTCDITKLTATQSGLGGEIKSYAARFSSVPCSFMQKTVSTFDEYGKESLITKYRFYIEATAANRNIVKTDRLTYDSREFEIKAIHNVAGKNRTLQIDCREVD